MCLAVDTIHALPRVKKVYKTLQLNEADYKIVTPFRGACVGSDGWLVPSKTDYKSHVVSGECILVYGGYIHAYDSRPSDKFRPTFKLGYTSIHEAYAFDVIASDKEGRVICKALWIPDACEDIETLCYTYNLVEEILELSPYDSHIYMDNDTYRKFITLLPRNVQSALRTKSFSSLVDAHRRNR